MISIFKILSLKGPSNTLLKKLIKDTGWLFNAQVITSGVNLIQAVVVARMLGVKNYGILALIIIYVEMVNQIIDFRVWETATKYLSEYWVKKEKDKALATVKLCYFTDLTTGVLSFATVVLTASLASKYILHEPEIGALIAIYALSLLLKTTDNTSIAILRVFDKFKWLSFYEIFINTTRFILIMSLLLIGFGLKGVLFGYIIAAGLGGGIAGFYALYTIRRKFKKPWWMVKVNLIKDKWKEMAWFLGNTNLNAFLRLFSSKSDIILLGYFTNPIEVGYYKLARDIVYAVSRISEPINKAIYPLIAKLISAKKEIHMIDLIKKISFFIGIFVVFTGITVSFFGEKLVILFAGFNFRPTGKVLIILIWSITWLIFIWIPSVLLSLNRTGTLTLINLVSTILLVGGLLFVIPSYGIIGTAVVVLLYYIFWTLLALTTYFLLVRKRYERISSL